MDYTQLIRDLGYPAVVSIGLGLAVWKSIKWTAEKVVQPFVHKHLELVGEIQESMRRQQATMDRLTTNQEQQTEILQDQSLQLAALAKSLVIDPQKGA